MKKIILALALVALTGTHIDSASATTRSLVCARKNGDNLTLGLCGVHGCPSSTSVSSVVTNYVLNRKRNSNGSLSYTPRAGFHPQCKVTISALRNGVRKATRVSCAPSLKNTSCVFQDN